MKYFVFSDAHGEYDALMKALNESSYDPRNQNHTLISCGDNFGRADTGKGSKGIYEYLINDIHYNKPICLMGNHELILKDILFRRSITFTDYRNGEHKTILSLSGKSHSDEVTFYDIFDLNKSPFMDWLLSLSFYFETNNYIFVHGFLPFNEEKLTFITKDFKNVTKECLEASTWSVTNKILPKFMEDFENGLNKTIVFGHWHAEELKKLFPSPLDSTPSSLFWYDSKHKLIGIDCCTFRNHALKILVIED